METNIKVRNAKLSDAPRILEIYTYYVENTVITFEYDVPSLEEFENRMIEGETLQQAIDYGLEVYGENDIVWYLNQNTGRHPHSAASYPIIQGDAAARLTAPGMLTNGAAEQQTPAAA